MRYGLDMARKEKVKARKLTPILAVIDTQGQIHIEQGDQRVVHSPTRRQRSMSPPEVSSLMQYLGAGIKRKRQELERQGVNGVGESSVAMTPGTLENPFEVDDESDEDGKQVSKKNKFLQSQMDNATVIDDDDDSDQQAEPLYAEEAQSSTSALVSMDVDNSLVIGDINDLGQASSDMLDDGDEEMPSVGEEEEGIRDGDNGNFAILFDFKDPPLAYGKPLQRMQTCGRPWDWTPPPPSSDGYTLSTISQCSSRRSSSASIFDDCHEQRDTQSPTPSAPIVDVAQSGSYAPLHPGTSQLVALNQYPPFNPTRSTMWHFID